MVNIREMGSPGDLYVCQPFRCIKVVLGLEHAAEVAIAKETRSCHSS